MGRFIQYNAQGRPNIRWPGSVAALGRGCLRHHSGEPAIGRHLGRRGLWPGPKLHFLADCAEGDGKPRLVRRMETDSFRVGEATSRCHKLGTWIHWHDSTRDRRASATEWEYGAPPRRCHMTTTCLARRERLPARGRGERRKLSMRPICAWLNPLQSSEAVRCQTFGV